MTNFSLSDILRHIITGTFFLFFFIILLVATTNIEVSELKGIFQESEWLWIITLIISYPLGISIQSINKELQKCYKFLITDILFCRYSIKRKSCRLKKTGNAPEWIYTAEKPEKIVEYMEMEMEDKKNAIVNEYHYFCELFQGLYISFFLLIPFIIFTLYSTYTTTLPLKFPDIILIIITILIVIGIFSFRFAHFYAKKFIYSLDAYKDVLDINIDKYMHEWGVQRVFVMMRIRSAIKYTKKSLKYLEEAISSVYRQDYYDINFVVLEDNDKPSLEDKILSLHEKYVNNRNNVRLFYYHSKSDSPAKSSYSIRSQILNIADKDDDIIFILDDDDMFAHNNIISDVVYQMNKMQKADICLVKYNIIGEPQMNIARNGGNTHNKLTTKLCGKRITIQEAPCLCFASSLGWSKIYRMGILKKYFLMIDETKEKLKNLKLYSYEDFPDFLVFLLKNNNNQERCSTVTGLNESAYLYRKHENTATREISEEAFQKWRINQLKLLVKTAKEHSQKLIGDYEKYLKCYLKAKTEEIEEIIKKYNSKELLTNYAKSNFYDDLKESFGADYTDYLEVPTEYTNFKNCIDKTNNDDKFDNCNFDKNCTFKKE